MSACDLMERELAENHPAAARLMSSLPSVACRRRNEPPWTLEYISEGARRVTGFPPEDLLDDQKTAYSDLIHPEDSELVCATIQDAVESDRPFRVAYRLRTADGSQKWIYEQGRCVGLDTGSRVLEGFITDVTAQTRVGETLRRKTAQLETLQEVGLGLGAKPRMEDLLRAIASRALDLVEAAVVVLSIYRPKRGVLESVATVGDRTLLPAVILSGEDVSGEAPESAQHVSSDDSRRRAGSLKNAEALAPRAAVVAIPLRRKDELLGVLDIVADDSRGFSQDDAALLGLLATHAAVAVRNAQLYEEAALRVKHQTIINRVAHAASKTLDLDDLAQVVYREIEAAFDPDAFFLALYDRTTDELDYRLQMDHGTMAPPERGPLGSGLTASVIRQQEPLLIRDFEKEREHLPPGELWGTMQTPASWLGVPMQVAGRPVGVICLQAYRADAYSELDQEMLSTIAEQVGIAVENARLYEETSHRLAQTQILREFMLAATSTLDFDQVLERTLTALHAKVGAEFIGFAMPGPQEKWLRLHPSCIGFTEDADPVPLEGDSWACALAFLTGEPVLVDDVRRSPACQLGTPRAVSGLAVPVSVNGRVAGVLSVESPRPNAFDQQDLDFYATVTGQLSIALENARLFEAEREQRRQTEALEEAAAVVNGTLDLDQVLDRILEQVERVIDGDAFNIILIEDDDTARVVRRRGYDREDWGVLSLSFGEYPVLLEMIETGKPKVVPDTAADPDWILEAGQEQWRSYVGVPIMVGGLIVGFLNVNSTRPTKFTHRDGKRLQAFADHVATAIENAKLYQELHNHADALEERVRERTSQLRTQYAQLATILESTADGIVLAGSDGELILANPVAREWLRQTLSPEESEQLQAAIRGLATRAEGRPEMVLELTGLDLQLTAAPVSKPAVEGASAVVALHDITHLKALNRMKSRFVSNVSHELRTPIATIKLLVHLMQEQPERREEYLEPLMREARHQAKLVRDILEMSRVDAGRLDIHPEPMSLNHLARESLVTHKNQARSQDLALECQVTQPDPIAMADSRWMLQVMNNLMSNAIRYTPAGGTICVSTGTAVADGRSWATITVSDTGIGIPEEELPYIFDRFFRGDQPQAMQISGTGLGLAILKEIVELHGGQVTVESKVNKGSSFTVLLPHQPQ